MSVQTPVGLLSFPHLFTPKPRSQGGEAVHSASLIFDEDAQKDPKFLALKQEIRDAIAEKWGDAKAKDHAFIKSLHMPIRDAAEKAYDGYGDGKVFISPWTKIKPGVIDRNKKDIIAPADVWAGQLARFFVTAFAWENSGKRGVSLQLEHVQIVKADMPRLDGRKSASQAFDDDLGADAGDDDDMPF